MNRPIFPTTRDKRRLRHVVAVLHVLAVVVLTGLAGDAGLCAEVLKPRQVIEKPQRTVVSPTHYSTYSIYVKFRDDSNVRLRGGQLTDLGSGALVTASPLLDSLGAAGASWERQHRVPEERLDQFRETGQRNTGKALPDLNTAYILHLSEGMVPAQVIDNLNALDVVEIALPLPLPAPLPVAPNFQPQQGYLNPDGATNGVDANYAWTVPGGDGANVNIVDIEYAWNLNHGDLSALLIGPTPGTAGR